MKPLESSYVSHSLTFRLIQRIGDVAMYGAWQDGHPPQEWEVFIVAKWPASSIMGKKYPPREAVPGNEDWGTNAWTCGTQKAADFRFDMALKEAQRRREAKAG